MTIRIASAFLVLTVVLVLSSAGFAQEGGTAPPSPIFAPSDDLATGHSYAGVDLGLSGSMLPGSQNFFWSISRPDSHLWAYLPFANLGSGIGFVGGGKVGIALDHWLDLEAKVRFLTNHTSQTSSVSVYLDPLKDTIHSTGTSHYSMTLSSLSFALLAHLRLSDRFYAIGGFGFARQTGNSFEADQTVAPTSYYRTDVHSPSYTTFSLQQAQASMPDYFESSRTDLQVGAGSVFRLGSHNMLLGAELLLSIPLTDWLTPAGKSPLDSTVIYFNNKKPLLPAITYPRLWYATLTVGLRLPFETLPPPVLTPINYQESEISPSHWAPEWDVDTSHAFLLAGQVTDALTGKPLSAAISAVDLSNNLVIAKDHTDFNGNYRVRVKGSGKYSVTAIADEYLFGSAYFEVDSQGRILKSDPESHPNIALARTPGGRTRLLVFFDFDKADLEPASLPELNRAIDLMKSIPTLLVEIAGYSDTTGAYTYNKDLSLRRANAVREFLIQHGILSDRITAHGYGPTSPLASNDTEEGRAENRRVEFVVVGH